MLAPLLLQPMATAAPAPPAPSPSAAPALPALAGFTWSVTDETATLTLHLPQAVVFEERGTPEAWQLFLPGLAADLNLETLYDDVLPALKSHQAPEGTTIEIPWKYWCPTEYALEDGARKMAITFRKRYKQVRQDALAPGIVHEHRRSADEHGPLNVNVLRVDPKQPGVKLMPGMAKGGSYFSREPVSAITRRYGAVAGINGSYFSTKTGEPLGLLMIDGQLVSSPLYNRAALAIADRGDMLIGNTQLSTRLTLPTGESYDFDGINQKRGLNRMVLYTAHYGASTFSPAGGKDYSLLPDGTIYQISAANAPIPPGGYVISAHGQAAQWLDRYAKVGTKIQLKSALAEFWPGVRHAISGGPTLLRGGEVSISALEEQFKPDVTYGIAPRTAIGLTKTGEVLLVTVDGRQPRFSRGLSLAGLAALMRDLGAVEAMNMDGGGSTAMAIGPVVVNKPSDGSERAVNNALLVFAAGAGQLGRK